MLKKTLKAGKRAFRTRKTSSKPELAQEVTSPQSVASPQPSSSGFRAYEAPSDDPDRAFDGVHHVRLPLDEEYVKKLVQPEDGSGEPPASSDDLDDDNVGGIFNKAHDIKFVSGKRGNKIIQIGGGSRPLTGFNGAYNIDFEQFNFAAAAESTCLLRHYQEAHNLTFQDVELEFNGEKTTSNASTSVPNAQDEQRAKQNHGIRTHPGTNLVLHSFPTTNATSYDEFLQHTSPGTYILIPPPPSDQCFDHANQNPMH
ncbi:hypothetical protein K435DRAFT_802023 [Dendrothele bispora CBS 962.96]|uniref:Uncharacterized protein n=1 Tax=Dendrothele bispora (strain CBS 962.96) TaxID=1314807 RepID=A0A4S8LMF2_DENBC|nr:hypothetical protein K435DRAFT_802023 [Dendrothele bispora CBS 962.96]